MYNKTKIIIDLAVINSSEKLISFITKELMQQCKSILYYEKIIINHKLKFYSEYGGFLQLLYYIKDNFNVDFLNKNLILDKHIEESICLSPESIEQWSEFARINNVTFPYKPNIVFDNEDLKIPINEKKTNILRKLCWKFKNFITSTIVSKICSSN
jgi:hypothetical protein